MFKRTKIIYFNNWLIANDIFNPLFIVIRKRKYYLISNFDKTDFEIYE